MIKPLRDRVLLELDSPRTVTDGGIIIPENARKKPLRAKVRAVGSGEVKNNGQIIPLEVQSGDTVYVNQYAGFSVKHKGRDYLIVRQAEIEVFGRPAT